MIRYNKTPEDRRKYTTDLIGLKEDSSNLVNQRFDFSKRSSEGRQKVCKILSKTCFARRLGKGTQGEVAQEELKVNKKRRPEERI